MCIVVVTIKSRSRAQSVVGVIGYLVVMDNNYCGLFVKVVVFEVVLWF